MEFFIDGVLVLGNGAYFSLKITSLEVGSSGLLQGSIGRGVDLPFWEFLGLFVIVAWGG